MATDNIPDGAAPTPRKPLDVWSGEEPITGAAKPGRRKTPTGKKVDREGQISVVLGGDRKELLDRTWKANLAGYETRSDLIRAAIDEKLDRLDRQRK